MMEEWRAVPGYEGLYEVSSYGRVRSLDRYVKACYGTYRLNKGRILSPRKTATGYYGYYLQVSLCCNGKLHQMGIHRLVAQAFLPNPDNLPEVNHIDENPGNNNVDNLEWCDHKYNMNYGTRKERSKETAIKNGYWTGLSKEEYKKEYRGKNKEKIREYMKEYNREYKKKNREKNREYMREYRKKRKNK